MQKTLIVRRVYDDKLEEMVIDESGSYFDPSRVIYDSSRDDSIPQAIQAELNTQKTLDEQAERSKRDIRLAEIYLRSTDWYVIRKVETNIPIPQDVLDARAQARIKANRN